MIDTIKLTPEWLAGFFDGEGSITVTNVLSLQVIVSQSNLELLVAIQGLFGGSIGGHKPRRGHKICYSLRWCGKKAAEFLTVIFPYLVVKRERAEIAIKLQSLVGTMGVPTQTRQEREALATEIKDLNDSHWSRRPMVN